MPQEQGYVLSVEGNGWVQVATERNSACGHCAAASQCCQSAMYNNRVATRALNRAGAHEGDIVYITMNAPSVLKAALLVYMVPLIGLVLGSVVGGPLGSILTMNATAAAIIFAAVGFIGGLGIAMLVSRHLAHDLRYIPVVTQVVRPNGGPGPPAAVDSECRACPIETRH
jgi:sigma-E factor negative regulatory protein RseC